MTPKKLIKKIAVSISFIIFWPLGWTAKLSKIWLGSSYLFHLFAESLSLLPVHLGIYPRTVFYHTTLKKTSCDLITLFGSILTNMDTTIGSKVIIGGRTTIGLCDIGNHSNIGNGTTILSGRRHHNFNEPKQMMNGPACIERIKIGRYVFIGDNCTIMANVGNYTIVGAGSVVVNPVPDGVVAVGNPARVIKKRQNVDELINIH